MGARGRARATGDSVDAFAGVRRAGVTLSVGLACALCAPAGAAASTIHVNETRESATFVNGGAKPAGYSDSIAKLSNDNGKCSLREAIEASNTDKPVDGCRAGTGLGDVVKLPAGRYHLYDNLIVTQRVVIHGANAGRPGNDPGRGAETIIKLVNNPDSIGQPALFWLGAPSPGGPASGGGSEFIGLTLAGNSNPLCINDPGASSTGPCEEWAIVQPEKSGGGANSAPGLQLRNSIVRDFTAGIYLGGKGAVIKNNLFKDNSRLLGNPSVVNVGIDLYSDAVYTNVNPVVEGNVFANPRIAAVELQGVPNVGEEVSGGLIRDNLINLKNGEPYFAVLLLNTQGQRIQDNVIRDPSPPPVQTLCCTDGIELDAVRDVAINGNTITGLAAALRVSEAYYPVTLPGLSNVRVANNRFYGNLHGIRVFTPYPPSSIDARGNWWGANGGAGSSGARPNAANPVNGVWFGHIQWPEGIVVENPPPPPSWINTADPLQLGCSMPANITANTPVPLTGSVPGMPAVDRSASTSPWFESIHVPTMAAGVSGVPGSTFGFDQPPTNGFSAGQVIESGGSLTGVLVATAPGAGAGHVALDSEQVACPFHAAPAELVIDKTPHTRVAHPGDLLTYRISVRNRGHAPVRGLRACDRAPHALRFVRSTPRLRRAAGGRWCLTIRTLQPGARATLHATFQVRDDVTAQTVSNGASAAIPTEPSPLPPSSSVIPKAPPRVVVKEVAKIHVLTAPRVTG